MRTVFKEFVMAVIVFGAFTVMAAIACRLAGL